VKNRFQNLLSNSTVNLYRYKAGSIPAQLALECSKLAAAAALPKPTPVPLLDNDGNATAADNNNDGDNAMAVADAMDMDGGEGAPTVAPPQAPPAVGLYKFNSVGP
jgi:hypothetical protein